MMVLVSYDVSTTSASGQKRLRRSPRRAETTASGCNTPCSRSKWISPSGPLLKSKLCDLIDPEQDSLRFYYLGKNWQTKVEHVGAKPVLDLNGPLIL
jgi:CRISPR-associated protein Cas2